jgi:hypothetical protein
MIVSDATAVGAMIDGAATDDVRLGFFGLTAYALAGPVVHVANGEWRRGLGSLFLRTVLPGVGLLIGGSALHIRCAGCGSGESLGLGPAVPGMLVGAAIGAAIASAIDIGVVAGHDRDPSQDPPRVTWFLAQFLCGVLSLPVKIAVDCCALRPLLVVGASRESCTCAGFGSPPLV